MLPALTNQFDWRKYLFVRRELNLFGVAAEVGFLSVDRSVELLITFRMDDEQLLCFIWYSICLSEQPFHLRGFKGVKCNLQLNPINRKMAAILDQKPKFFFKLIYPSSWFSFNMFLKKISHQSEFFYFLHLVRFTERCIIFSFSPVIPNNS